MEPYTERVDGEWRDPVGLRAVEVLGREVAAAEVQQAGRELAAVEAGAPVGGDGAQGPADARSAHERPDVRRLAGDLVEVGAGGVVDRRQCADEQRTGREAVLGDPDRRCEHVGEGDRAEPLVQRDPAVDATGQRHRADVVAERHLGMSRRAECEGIGTGARSSAGVEGGDRASGVHEDEQVSTETAQVG